MDYTVHRTQNYVPYTMEIQFGGHVAYSCPYMGIESMVVTMPVNEILVGQPNCNGNVCTFSGVFNGIQGIDDDISYRYCAVGQPC